MSYDQWKTASPYDDEPDPIEEAERFLKEHDEGVLTLETTKDLDWAKEIIDHLLGIIYDEL